MVSLKSVKFLLGQFLTRKRRIWLRQLVIKFHLSIWWYEISWTMLSNLFQLKLNHRPTWIRYMRVQSLYFSLQSRQKLDDNKNNLWISELEWRTYIYWYRREQSDKAAQSDWFHLQWRLEIIDIEIVQKKCLKYWTRHPDKQQNEDKFRSGEILFIPLLIHSWKIRNKGSNICRSTWLNLHNENRIRIMSFMYKNIELNTYLWC